MNLLPATEKDLLKENLKAKVLILGLGLMSVVFVLGFIMLLPSYFLARGNFYKISSENELSAAVNKGESLEQILNLPQEIKNKMEILQFLNFDFSASTLIGKVAGEASSEIKLISFSLARNQNFKEKQGLVITVSGLSANRDALVNFLDSLKKSNLFSEVEMPVSSLTKEKNLPFNINLFIENA